MHVARGSYPALDTNVLTVAADDGGNFSDQRSLSWIALCKIILSATVNGVFVSVRTASAVMR